MSRVIEMKQVSFAYDHKLVLQKADMAVEEGDFAAIIGSNGAGKSTLVKLLLHEISTQSGVIRLFGEDIASFHHWQSIGYLPQSIQNPNFPATAAEIVSTNLYSRVGLFHFPKKEHRQMVQDALHKVGMEAYAGRMLGTLSGGQRQRILLARVLVAQPKLLFLDEPTVGIDEASVKSLYRLLKELNRTEKITIVMITHDLHGALPYANRILQVCGGIVKSEEVGCHA